MLVIAHSLRDIAFGRLMEVYRETNLLNGHDLAPEETEDRQLFFAEQDFYSYLRDVFFRTINAVYAVWQEAGKYVSALRLEPYKDGFLLEGLETACDERKKGYARKLVESVQETLPPGSILYSHVDKSNTASLHVHFSCGFTVCDDFSSYIDGSVNNKSYTLIYKK